MTLQFISEVVRSSKKILVFEALSSTKCSNFEVFGLWSLVSSLTIRSNLGSLVSSLTIRSNLVQVWDQLA